MSDTPASEGPTVLVVDDEPEVTDAYALVLRDRYDVRTAYGGGEALDVVDASVDVVLLDRRMPTPGDEVLAAVRERGLPVRVIMLTAIDPEFDIIGMPFDDYLCKPLEDEDLFSAIDQQLRVAAYEDLSEYFEVTAKRTLLETQMATSTLEESEEFATLDERATTLREGLAATLDDEEFERLVETFEHIDRESE
jgi:DNA-binding response OmpR family regulator